MLKNNKDTVLLSKLKNALEEGSASNIVVLDAGTQNPYFGYFIIATGTCAAHLTSLTKVITEAMQGGDYSLRSSEGKREGKWILMDFGYIVIHLLDNDTREFYDLDGIWAGAEKVQFANIPYLAD